MKPSRYFAELASLYDRMDQAWERVARQYGFVCNGCEDNCCMTLFFHHTHIEQDYLRFGLKQLPAARRSSLKKRAATAVSETAAALEKQEPVRIMCPANLAGRCILYPYRPMICRMHGIPHVIRFPGKPDHIGPGCDAGSALFKEAPHRFDRTPHYREMARLEQAYRLKKRKTGSIRRTIAEILR